MSAKNDDGIVEIEFRDQCMTLTVEEARKLYYELKNMFEPYRGLRDDLGSVPYPQRTFPGILTDSAGTPAQLPEWIWNPSSETGTKITI